MRVFYLFRINKFFSYVYKDKPSRIYYMLEELYNTRCVNKDNIYRYYEQIAIPFNKDSLFSYLKSINYKYYHMGNIYYIVENNIIVSKLTISNCNLKINTLDSYTYFFNILSSYANDIFVCDFDNKDYFWLDKIFPNIDNKVVI